MIQLHLENATTVSPPYRLRGVVIALHCITYVRFPAPLQMPSSITRRLCLLLLLPPIACCALSLSSCQSTPSSGHENTAYEDVPELFKMNPWLTYYASTISISDIRFDIERAGCITDMAKVDGVLAARRSALNSVSSDVAIAESYLGRHPSSYYQKDLTKYKAQLADYESEYANVVKYLAPYKAEYQVEARRAASRTSKYRELVLKFIAVQGIPPQCVLDSQSFLFYLDDATFRNGQIVIHSHLAIPPDKGVPDVLRAPDAQLTIHGSVNGQSLGRASAVKMLGVSYLSAGHNSEFIHTFTVDDLQLPTSGEIDIVADLGLANAPTLKVAYSDLEQRPRNTGSTIVIQGRRSGDHLFVPTMFHFGGKDVSIECLLDTGATLTTIPKSMCSAQSQVTHSFSTANGEITMPVTTSSVTVGAVAREIEVALSSDESIRLLGANFFDGYLYTIDLENSAIYLIKR